MASSVASVVRGGLLCRWGVAPGMEVIDDVRTVIFMSLSGSYYRLRKPWGGAAPFRVFVILPLD